MSHSERIVFQRSVLFAGSFTFLLWLVRTIEWGTASNFGMLGILPRSTSGMVGIITAPLIHGTFIHLLSNTFPLLLLLIAVFYFYDKIALEVFAWIYLITGCWVWIAAREAYHIGASGLVYGLATFLFFSGIFRRDARSVAVAVAIAFLYSGMVQGIMPSSDPNVSWESHLLGSVAGIFCSFYFRKLDQGPTKQDRKSLEETTISTTGQQCSFRSSEASSTYYLGSDEDQTPDSPFMHYRYKGKE